MHPSIVFDASEFSFQFKKNLFHHITYELVRLENFLMANTNK